MPDTPHPPTAAQSTSSPTADTHAGRRPWYAPGLRFTCTQCGNCCTGPPGYVWFDDAEAQAMAAFLGLSIETFRRRHARTIDGHWTLNERLSPDARGYDCVFLLRREDGTTGCSIYAARPTQCRTWPFWPENLASPAAWRRAANTCPGMTAGMKGHGDFYPIEAIRIQRDKTPNI